MPTIMHAERAGGNDTPPISSMNPVEIKLKRKNCEIGSEGRGSQTLSGPGQAPAVAVELEVTQGHGAGVGDVVGLGQAVQAQFGADGVLHLKLGGLAAAGH